MKVNCEIIEDLLPLYVDKVCSEQSRQAVEKHLQECDKCRRVFESTQAVRVPHIEPDHPTADKAVKKGFQKIRIRWWASILLVVLILPLLFLGWNQYHNRGIHYTNLNEYRIGNAFMKLIAEGKYEQAYEYYDIEGLKKEWLKNWFDETKLANMESDGLAKFCEYGAKLEAAGGIDQYEYIGINRGGADEDGNTVYRLVYQVKVSGTPQIFEISVSDDGIEHLLCVKGPRPSLGGEGSFLDDPLTQFSIWSEYLWQDYAGCYYDPDLKESVYYDAIG